MCDLQFEPLVTMLSVCHSVAFPPDHAESVHADMHTHMYVYTEYITLYGSRALLVTFNLLL